MGYLRNFSHPLRVALLTITPTSRPPDAEVLSLAPYALQSYAQWRLGQEGIQDSVIFRVFHYVEGVSLERIAEEINAFLPDLFVLSAYVWNLLELLHVARLIRVWHPGVVIVMGGPQASPIAEDVLRENFYLDAVAYSVVDGEIVFFHLVKSFITGVGLKEVPGLVCRDEMGGLYRLAPPNEILDFYSIPSPYLDGTIVLEPGKKYRLSIETSRGCAFDCAYCFWGKEERKVRFFALERILAELDSVFS
ncbi:MAG: cobalamin-dependent protein [Magnetococcus sp. DMHC-6]